MYPIEVDFIKDFFGKGGKMELEAYMESAIAQAKLAYALKEVPIGCVIVRGDKIIGVGYNERNTKKNALCHAEISAINQACEVVGDWRLEDCILFVTIEPCPMCAGAILQARIPKVVFGARNAKAGGVLSVLNILDNDQLNHQVEIVEGVLEAQCSALMRDFFRDLRQNK